jgi:hypothetical protein
LNPVRLVTSNDLSEGRGQPSAAAAYILAPSISVPGVSAIVLRYPTGHRIISVRLTTGISRSALAITRAVGRMPS